MEKYIYIFTAVLFTIHLKAQDGHKLWLRNAYKNEVNIICTKHSTTLRIAKNELQNNWQGDNGITISLKIKKDKRIKGDGFIINSNNIQANSDKGILYGVYELLRQQQTRQVLEKKVYNPSYELRLLNHWDNLNGKVERGYAGSSIFWKNDLTVSEEDKKLWKAYARANASIGINATAINNVNASPNVLKTETLERIKAIADILRPFGIQVFLSINFASPKAIGGLNTADPLNLEVGKWWKVKVKEIYKAIPDFGGFVVKANSEGQPGPQDYGRTHAEGANMLARILKPYNGVIMWRAFVYGHKEDDRVKEAYNEFKPFDGKFDKNVLVQVKNGPIDFQPREPISPLFGALKKTAIAPELQITQEYLGHSTHLVFLAPMWEEFFHTDTYQEGQGSTTAKCTDGSIFKFPTAIAGVANIGKDKNWCGHDFAQANWYAYGRMAWDNQLTSDQIAEEWIKLTFTPNTKEKVSFSEDWSSNFLTPIKNMMLSSHEAAVNYMMPLGLTHIFKEGHHYGPGPWFGGNKMEKAWASSYYHRSDTLGIGFNRTSSGTNAVAQYHEPLNTQYSTLDSCPEKFLLWFNYVPWDYKVKSGNTLWEEILLSL